MGLVTRRAVGVWFLMLGEFARRSIIQDDNIACIGIICSNLLSQLQKGMIPQENCNLCQICVSVVWFGMDPRLSSGGRADVVYPSTHITTRVVSVFMFVWFLWFCRLTLFYF
jgi:hypothetical protein